MDREKIIKQIEKCISDTSCIGCPYEKSLVCRHYMLADALATLKEQEQDRIDIAHEMVSNSILMYQGKEIVRCKDCKYCKVIDWDDSNPYYGSCQYFNTHTVDADGFCYKAERKGF